MFSAFPVIKFAEGGLEKTLQIQVRLAARPEQAEARHPDIARASVDHRGHGGTPDPHYVAQPRSDCRESPATGGPTP